MELNASIARLGAVVRRDVLLRITYPFQLFMLVWSVLVSVFMFFFLGRLVGDSEALRGLEGGYFAYAVTGIAVIALSFATIEVFKASIAAEQQSGTLEILLASPTSLRILLAGGLVVPVTLALIEASIYAAFGSLLAPDALSWLDWLRAAPVILLIVGAFAGIGLWSAAFVIVAQRGDPFSGLFVQASNLVAGAVFPVALLPEWLQTVARFVPTFYGFEALRGLMLTDATWAEVSQDVLILVLFDVVLLLLGVVWLRLALRLARRMGTLSN